MLRPHRIVSCGGKPRAHQEVGYVMRIGSPPPASRSPASPSSQSTMSGSTISGSTNAGSTKASSTRSGSTKSGSPGSGSPPPTPSSPASGSPADGLGQPRRASQRHSLALRLLVITVALVAVAEIMVLIPNIARDRSCNPAREDAGGLYRCAVVRCEPVRRLRRLQQRDELLRASGIDSIRLRDSRGTTLVLTGDANAQPAKTFDLRDETTIDLLWRGMVRNPRRT